MAPPQLGHGTNRSVVTELACIKEAFWLGKLGMAADRSDGKAANSTKTLHS